MKTGTLFFMREKKDGHDNGVKDSGQKN